jgi:hypothetical protein
MPDAIYYWDDLAITRTEALLSTEYSMQLVMELPP